MLGLALGALTGLGVGSLLRGVGSIGQRSQLGICRRWARHCGCGCNRRGGQQGHRRHGPGRGVQALGGDQCPVGGWRGRGVAESVASPQCQRCCRGRWGSHDTRRFGFKLALRRGCGFGVRRRQGAGLRLGCGHFRSCRRWRCCRYWRLGRRGRRKHRRRCGLERHLQIGHLPAALQPGPAQAGQPRFGATEIQAQHRAVHQQRQHHSPGQALALSRPARARAVNRRHSQRGWRWRRCVRRLRAAAAWRLNPSNPKSSAGLSAAPAPPVRPAATAPGGGRLPGHRRRCRYWAR